MKIKIFCVAFFAIQIAIAQCVPESEFSKITPKRDLRGVFLTTVFNLDWPSNKTATPAVQQAELIAILDNLQINGYNTVFFQVRPSSDALYASTIEPWSNYLTGTEGLAPNPIWDPLQFAITESHKRGLDLHAWLNPYRSKNGTYIHASNHPSTINPSWILTSVSSASLKILDPGLPAVRNYIVSIIQDIATRYDVDGIHFDDYFYPTSFMAAAPNSQDSQTFINNNPTNLTLANWRRNNGNIMIGMVYDAIQTINANLNKNIVFGVSPSGIWKSGTPAGITGGSNFNDQFYDPIAWLDAGKVDYLAPQVYWRITGAQDYNILTKWWNDQVKSRNKQVYMSQAYYKMTDTNQWIGSEIQDQINLNRAVQMDATFGQIAYRYVQIKNNDKTINTLLSESQYKFRSFAPPILGLGKDIICANSPVNIRLDGLILKWDVPTAASDGDLPKKYVVYAFNSVAEANANKEDGSKIVDITPGNELLLTQNQLDTKFFVVSSLDKNNNENGNFAQTLSNTNTISSGVLQAIYPNPFKNEFIISSTNDISVSEVELYDMSGKMVWSQKFELSASDITVNPSNVIPGMYIGQIIYTDSSRVGFKIIKE